MIFRGSLIDGNSTWYVVYEKETYVMFSDSDLPNPYEIAIAGMSNLFCLKYLLSFDTLTLSVS